jgi:hypothetical protein
MYLHIPRYGRTRMNVSYDIINYQLTQNLLVFSRTAVTYQPTSSIVFSASKQHPSDISHIFYRYQKRGDSNVILLMMPIAVKSTCRFTSFLSNQLRQAAALFALASTSPSPPLYTSFIVKSVLWLCLCPFPSITPLSLEC